LHYKGEKYPVNGFSHLQKKRGRGGGARVEYSDCFSHHPLRESRSSAIENGKNEEEVFSLYTKIEEMTKDQDESFRRMRN
jgi:hypothetical protein